MNRVPVRALIAAVALGLLALFVAACGSERDDAPAGSKQLTFKLTDAGCEPTKASAPAGPIDFKVENGGTAEVHRARGPRRGNDPRRAREHHRRPLRQLLADPRRRRIHGALQRRRRGEGDGTLKVTGKLETKASPEVEKAIAGYRDYLRGKHRRTDREDEAVRRRGDRRRTSTKAKQLYPAPRVPYERIEPVAESFGDLDPRIDARENDVAEERIRRLPPARESALGRRND